MSIECRPILLHNEFLPSISGPRQWDYQVLGYYDGITVLENTVIECTGKLKNLFDICVKYEGEERPYRTEDENVDFVGSAGIVIDENE